MPTTFAKRCLTLVGLTIFCSHSQAMTFEKQERCIVAAKPRCQTMIVGIGKIDKQTPDQFKAIAKDVPQGSWVALSSPGGSIVSAMRLGQEIRAAGFNTTVTSTDYSPPNCFSSCAYAFIGGISRHLPEGSKYGVHQFRGIDKALTEDESQKISAALASYVDFMGVDRQLLTYAQVTTSDKVSVLSVTQAKVLKIDNTGQSPYPRWRLEATANGQLLAINNPPQTAGKPPAALALFELRATDRNAVDKKNQDKLPAAKRVDKKLVLLIFYKSTDDALFNQRIEHQLVIDQKMYSLKQSEDWQKKTNGYQASFAIDDDAIGALATAPEESTINLNSAISSIRFGVGGFKNIYQALTNTGTDATASDTATKNAKQ